MESSWTWGRLKVLFIFALQKLVIVRGWGNIEGYHRYRASGVLSLCFLWHNIDMESGQMGILFSIGSMARPNRLHRELLGWNHLINILSYKAFKQFNFFANHFAGSKFPYGTSVSPTRYIRPALVFVLMCPNSFFFFIFCFLKNRKTISYINLRISDHRIHLIWHSICNILHITQTANISDIHITSHITWSLFFYQLIFIKGFPLQMNSSMCWKHCNKIEKTFTH